MFHLYLLFFFFKRKTAYELLRSLWGSEMFIRDRFGIEQEQYARETYIKLNNDVEVFEVASCKHDTIPHFAASPDGIVRGADLKCLEIKCPNIATHMM